ncbi:MAG: hypothetical protein AB8G95_29265 [Anaerolineae bacterium]
MKFNLDNGVPVWVWGILFVILFLAFSFRSQAPENNIRQPSAAPAEDSLETNPDLSQSITPFAANPEPEAVAPEVVQPTNTPVPELTAIPIPTVDPNATKPFVIDVGGEADPLTATPES